MSSERSIDRRGPVSPSWLLLALPLAGLAVLLARPELDLTWEHHPSHFWLVLVTAAVNVALAYLTNVVATRHRDPRVVLVSLAFLAAAGFLGLHALATPGVLLSAPNSGFVLATPVGLFIASVFAAASGTALAGPRGSIVLDRRSVLLAALVALMVAWGFVSVAGLPPLDGPLPPRESAGPLAALAGIAVALFGFAAWRTFELHLVRGGAILFAIGVALVLLAEAAIATALSRNWHLSWWEWHVLMLAAFLAIALGVRSDYRRRGSLTAAFGGLYLETTLARVDRWHAAAIRAVALARDRGEPTDGVLARLGQEGASEDQLALVAEAAEELGRLDALFRPYLPSHVANRLRSDPAGADLGGIERELSVLFADLAGFTAFSETHAPSEVIAMLNAYWAVVVPVIDRGSGVVEHFAGDGVLASFNANGDQPDHPVRAASVALAIVAQATAVAEGNEGWPTFRVGVNTGPAVLGNVGAAERRTFSVIGDTINVAARLMSAAEPGQVVVSGATWSRLRPGRQGTGLGPTEVKGKSRPVEAWVLEAVGPPG